MTRRTLQADAALEPLPDAAFDRARAGHLLRRAGFGASPAEVERARDQGLHATVDRLLDFRADGLEELDRIQDAAAAAGIESVQAWWAARMLKSAAPLREKLALFWHGHFATSAAKVQDARLMAQHLRIFLDHGRGPFLDLLVRVAEDPAMLIWLDAERNLRERPNENFARELFELFTLGIGHYDERDVQEAARAFTGWRRAGGRFEFVPERHDPGEKHVLDARGPLGGRDVLELCAAHPAATRRLICRLLRFFAHPSPDAAVVEVLAAEWPAHRLDAGWLLARVLRSRWFFSDAVVGARILSPAECIIGALRTLQARCDAGEVARLLADLGQDLLRPPTVEGWEGEEAWIHSLALVKRWNAAARIARGKAGGVALDLDPARVFGRAPSDPDALAGHFLDPLLLRPVDPTVRQGVAARVAAAGDDATRPEVALRAVLCLPEYHVG